MKNGEESMDRKLSRVSLVGILTGGILLASAGISHADVYMKIDSVQGESVVKGRVGQIEVGDFTMSATAIAQITPSGISTGKAKFQEVTVKKFFDSATEDTLKMLGTSKSFNSIVIEVTKPNGDALLKNGTNHGEVKV